MFLLSRRLCRSALVLCALAALCPAISASDRKESVGRDKNAATLRKKIEKVLRRGKGDFFVIALIETRFFPHVFRQLPDGGMEVTLSGPGQLVPVSKAAVRVIQGQDATVDAVVEHLGKFDPQTSIRTRAGRASSTIPRGDWKLVGRFADADKANAAMRAVQAACDAQVQADGRPSGLHKFPNDK